MKISTALCLLCLALANSAAAKGAKGGPAAAQPASLHEFLAQNSEEYGWVSASLQLLGEPYSSDPSLTVFLPPPTGRNSSAFAEDLAGLPLRTLEEYVGWMFLPQPYPQPADLLAAGEVTTLAHTPASFALGDSNKLVATFDGVGAGGIYATVMPLAFQYGESVVYLLETASFEDSKRSSDKEDASSQEEEPELAAAPAPAPAPQPTVSAASIDAVAPGPDRASGERAVAGQQQCKGINVVCSAGLDTCCPGLSCQALQAVTLEGEKAQRWRCA